MFHFLLSFLNVGKPKINKIKKGKPKPIQLNGKINDTLIRQNSKVKMKTQERKKIYSNPKDHRNTLIPQRSKIRRKLIIKNDKNL